jgi:hypothetical protein
MRKIIPIIFIVFIFIACKQRDNAYTKKPTHIFKMWLNPSFGESGEIVLSKINSAHEIQILLTEIERPNRPSDTFYYKKSYLTKDQFDKFESEVIQKIMIKQPRQPEGIRDGMSVNFMLIDKDTSRLYFRNPSIHSDTLGYNVTKYAIDNFRLFFNDSVITDYLDDIESYMDNSKPGIHMSDNRPINKLRKIEYSR